MNFRPANLLYTYLQLFQFDLHKAMMRHKLRKKAPSFTGRWLDVGAGDQPYRKFFDHTDASLTTNTRYHYTEAELARLNPLTTYWIDDGSHLPVDDNSLDGIACFQVLPVVDDAAAFFAEMHRVLKPGGRLLLSADFLYPQWSLEDKAHFTSAGLEKLCSGSGFVKPQTESFGGIGSAFYTLMMRYLRSFPGIWKQKSLLMKILTGFVYSIFLILLPLLSVKGMLIFVAERNISTNTTFAFNILLQAEKQ